MDRQTKTFQPFTKKRKLGYAFGIFTESLLYNMFYTYFLTFLVQIVGVSPALSGVVIFLSIVWDAVTDPIIGAFTDRPGVDKRRVMQRAILPLGIVFALSWLNWRSILGLTSVAGVIALYVLLTMGIWIFYTLYTIPYYAVVAEITQDYDERTSIRSLSSLLNAVAVALGNVVPALVSTVILGHAVTYFDVSAVLAVPAAALGFLAVASLKGIFLEKAELPPVKLDRRKALGETFRGFWEILKLKPFKFFILFVFFFLFASSMIQSSFSYSIVYCIGIPYDTGIVLVVASLVVTMAVVTPLAERLAKKKDRRASALFFVSLTAAGLFALRLIGLDVEIGGFRVMAVLLPAVCAVGLGAFWTLFYSMAYDFVEIDEFVNGERRESLITAVPQFIQKIGSGAGILTQGLLLSAYGYVRTAADYDNIFSPVSDPKVVEGMTNITTLYPAIALLLSVMGLVFLKTTRKNMAALSERLEKRRNGEAVTDDALTRALTGERKKVIKDER